MIITVLFTGILLVSVTVLTHYEVSRGDFEIEKTAGDINAGIAGILIQGKIENLERISYEWAVWDDSSLYLQDLFPEFEMKHIEPYDFTAAQIDVLIMTDQSGAIRLVHYASHIQPGIEREPAYTLLQDYSMLGRPGEPVSGITLYDGALALIASHPVLPTSGSGDPAGTLMMIRFIDSSFIDEFSTILSGNITFTPLYRISSHYKDPEMLVPFFTQNKEQNTFTTTIIHPDISGKPAMAVSVMSEFQTPYDQRTILVLILIILIGMILYTIAVVLWFKYQYYRHIQEVSEGLTAAALGKEADTLHHDIPSDLQPLIQAVKDINITIVEQIHSLDYSDRILSATEQRWKTLFSSAADAVLIGDDDGILLCNPRFEELTGYDASGIVGIPVTELFPDSSSDPECTTLQENWNNRQQKGIRFIWKICNEKTPDLTLDVNLRFVEIEGRWLRFCIGRDITCERILLAQEQEALAQIDKNMAQLAALNDEIRNPLTLISMNAGQVDEPFREQIMEGIAMIDKLVHRLDMGFTESEKVRNFLQRTINGFMDEKKGKRE